MRRLLDRVSIVKYLSRKYGDLLAELERIVESTDLGETTTDPGSTDQDQRRLLELLAGELDVVSNRRGLVIRELSDHGGMLTSRARRVTTPFQ